MKALMTPSQSSMQRGQGLWAYLLLPVLLVTLVSGIATPVWATPPGAFVTVKVKLSGIMGPDLWIIVAPGGATCNAGNPKGWIVTADNAKAPKVLTVKVPARAAKGTYEVRWRGSAAGYGYQRFSGAFPVP